MPKIVTIDFKSHECAILGSADPEVDTPLYEFLSYRPTGYWFSPKYQSYIQADSKNKALIERGLQPIFHLENYQKYWDGFVRLYKRGKRKFRTGLLTRVVEFLTYEKGFEVNVQNMPSPRAFKFTLSSAYEPRKYQLDVCNNICINRFGIIQSPPRSGKTIIFMAVVGSENEYPVLFFCRSLDIAQQTIEKLNIGLPHIKVGMIGDGKVEIGDITVITVQSAFSAYDKKYDIKKSIEEAKIATTELKLEVRKLITNAKKVFYDEAHHSGSDVSRLLLGKCINANMIIGLTATPFNDKPEDILVEEAIGPVIYKINYSTLIREGYLIAPTIYMYYLPPMKIEGSYQTIYKEAVVDNQFLSLLIKTLVNKLTSMGKSVVVQTTQVSHAKKLGKLLDVHVLVGADKDMQKGTTKRTKTSTRDEIRQKLINKEILCVVSTLFGEGVDLPSLDYTINAAGNKSEITIIQRMRSITAAEGKDFAGIIDFYHSCQYLKEHSRDRLKIYKSEPEFTIIKRDIRDWSIEDVRS